MTFEVSSTEAFENDISSAISYIRDDLCAPQAAQNLMQCVDSAVKSIAFNPFINAVSKRFSFNEQNYREALVSNYVIVYRVDGENVILLRFFHQTQLIERFVMEWLP